MIWYDLLWFFLWFDMICYDLLWFVMICYDLLWVVMICYDSLRFLWFPIICYGLYDLLWFVWFAMVCYDLLWFAQGIEYDANWNGKTQANHAKVIDHGHPCFVYCDGMFAHVRDMLSGSSHNIWCYITTIILDLHFDVEWAAGAIAPPSGMNRP